MAPQPGTNRQVPDQSILDHFGKQIYLGNQFTYILNSTAGGATEVTSILLSNPSVNASAFPTGVSLFVNLLQISGFTASANNVLRAYLNPTFSSAGTPAVALNQRPASPTTSVGVITTAPTVSVNGTLISAFTALPFATASGASLIILDPGQTLLVTVQTATSAVTNVQLSYYQL